MCRLFLELLAGALAVMVLLYGDSANWIDMVPIA